MHTYIYIYICSKGLSQMEANRGALVVLPKMEGFGGSNFDQGCIVALPNPPSE